MLGPTPIVWGSVIAAETAIWPTDLPTEFVRERQPGQPGQPRRTGGRRVQQEGWIWVPRIHIVRLYLVTAGMRENSEHRDGVSSATSDWTGSVVCTTEYTIGMRMI